MSSSLGSEAATPLNIRIKSDQRSLIEQAAEATEMTVSDFVREAAVREAENALLDRTTFELDETRWDEFVEALDAPPSDNPRLRDLMTRKAPWEK